MQTTQVSSMMGLSLSGRAGESINPLKITIQSSTTHIGAGSTANQHGGGVVINTEWYFWRQFTSTIFNVSTTPFGAAPADSPISIKYIDVNGITHHIALLPLINTVITLKVLHLTPPP